MSFVDSALRAWKSNVERADRLFGGLSPELLEQEVAPGKNRLIYLWGHLAAVNDGLLADGLRTIAQGCLRKNQPEAVRRFLEVLSLGLGAAAYCSAGRGFQTGAASESIHGSAREIRTLRLSLRAGDVDTAKGIVSSLECVQRRAHLVA
jgi:hypothetical protein